MKIDRKLLPFFIILAVLALLPLYFRTNSYVMHILIMCLIWGIVAANWDLIVGYGGVFSFGQIAFFAIGAYTSAVLAKTGLRSLDIGLSPWLSMFIGGGAAGLSGFLIGLPCLRLKGIYIALVTFTLHETLSPILRLGGDIGTGGAGGCVSIPPFYLGGYIFTPLERVPTFYLALAIFAVVIYLVYRLIHSPIGLAFVSLRDSEPLARSLGISEYKYKLILFTISAFLTGIAGAFYAHYTGLISRTVLGLDVFVLVIVMVIVGGLGRFPGAIIAAFIFTILNEFLRPLEAFRPIILGILAIVIIIWAPEGLTGIRGYFVRFRQRIKSLGVKG